MTSSGVLIALSFDSKEDVQAFADTAKANGGSYFKLDTGMPEDDMFGYEVLDPDGNQWEPMWMNMEAMGSAAHEYTVRFRDCRAF